MRKYVSLCIVYGFLPSRNSFKMTFITFNILRKIRLLHEASTAFLMSDRNLWHLMEFECRFPHTDFGLQTIYCNSILVNSRNIIIKIHSIELIPQR